MHRLTLKGGASAINPGESAGQMSSPMIIEVQGKAQSIRLTFPKTFSRNHLWMKYGTFRIRPTRVGISCFQRYIGAISKLFRVWSQSESSFDWLGEISRLRWFEVSYILHELTGAYKL